MNGASHQKFMSYEGTRLVPLLRFKLILFSTVWENNSLGCSDGKLKSASSGGRQKSALTPPNWLKVSAFSTQGSEKEWRSASSRFQRHLSDSTRGLRAPPGRSARFLSTVILTQTESHCDSSSNRTISKTAYCYFNPHLHSYFSPLLGTFSLTPPHCAEGWRLRVFFVPSCCNR